MPLKDSRKLCYINNAKVLADDSHCERLKVGCVIVLNDNIIASACNGTLPNRSNCCEINNVTLPEVVHAEAGAIAKLARSTQSSQGAAAFVTTCPCEGCATLIVTAGITEVYFIDFYRSTAGYNILKEAGVYVEQLNVEELERLQ